MMIEQYRWMPIKNASQIEDVSSTANLQLQFRGEELLDSIQMSGYNINTLDLRTSVRDVKSILPLFQTEEEANSWVSSRPSYLVISLEHPIRTVTQDEIDVGNHSSTVDNPWAAVLKPVEIEEV